MALSAFRDKSTLNTHKNALYIIPPSPSPPSLPLIHHLHFRDNASAASNFFNFSTRVPSPVCCVRYHRASRDPYCTILKQMKLIVTDIDNVICIWTTIHTWKVLVERVRPLHRDLETDGLNPNSNSDKCIVFPHYQVWEVDTVPSILDETRR